MMFVTSVGIVLLVVLFYLRPMNVEGFNTVPVPSTIPRDTAGATTANPLKANPQPKDIEATLETIKNFKLLLAQKDPLKTNLSQTRREGLTMLRPMIPQIENRLQKALEKPNESDVTLEDVEKQRQMFEGFIAELRGASVVGTAQAKAELAKKIQTERTLTTVSGPPGVITMAQLKELQSRIQGEVKKLNALRSKSATLIARKNQLEKMLADLNDIISAVERKAMKLEDVPITPQSAEAFLKAMGAGKALTALMVPKGKTPAMIKASPSIATVPKGTDVQKLLDAAKYIKWELEVKLSYDPRVAMQDKMIQKLGEIESKLTAIAISETPISEATHKGFMRQLDTIRAVLVANGKDKDRKVPVDRMPTTYARENSLGTAEFPAPQNVNGAQGAGFGTKGFTFPNGEISPEVYIRPGFVMTDDTIARRASSSAFDESTVGGPDYKKRALELCRQVQSAQLGDPKNFGCIENPDAVSSRYSWKGNYEMVCNRVGDTWGGWYPEMFGCPKHDPTAKFRGTML